MTMLDEKVAFITGAGQGLGEGTAHALAREGAAVVLADIRVDNAEKVAAAVRREGGRAHAVSCDVRDRASVDAAVKDAISTFGRLDILINNAMTQDLVPFAESTAEELQGAYETSVLGTFNCMQSCFAHLKVAGGKVVNFGSNAGTEGIAGMATYAAAKEGVAGLSRAVAAEWGRHAITVNVVVPNGLSPAWEELKSRSTHEALERMMDRPIRRMGDPIDDVGRIVAFLSSPYSDYMTGRTLFADGGKGRLS